MAAGDLETRGMVARGARGEGRDKTKGKRIKRRGRGNAGKVRPAPDHWTSAKLFAGKPIQARLYRHIKAFVETLGPVAIKVTKTQVSFASRRQFAWVWLPMEWAKHRPPNSLVLSFALGQHLTHPRIVQAVEPYPGRWMHHVIIQAESDLTAEVHRWLAEAFAFATTSQKRTARRPRP